MLYLTTPSCTIKGSQLHPGVIWSNSRAISSILCLYPFPLLCSQGKVEQLAADWKALDGHLRESLQVPVSPWKPQQHVVQHQQLGKKRGEIHFSVPN